MKLKFFGIALISFFCANLLQAQNCGETLQLFAQSAKIKDYKTARPQYEKLIENCPEKHIAIYQYGDIMFKHFLKEAKDSSKVKDLAKKRIENNELRLKHFPNETDAQEMATKNAQIMYDYKMAPNAELFKKFDDAWNMKKGGYNNPKPLYTYFRLVIELYNDGQKELQDIFDMYDKLDKKIKQEKVKQASIKEPLIKKEETGAELTTKEKRKLKNAQAYLSNYTKIEGSNNSLLGDLADCENLIPLYKKQIAENKNDTTWLKRAAGRLSVKKCTDEPIFFTIVEALNEKSPSAKTAYYLGQLAEKEGKIDKALQYYKQSAELETDNLDKARVFYKLGGFYKDKGSYSSARSYYRKALNAQPSMGKAYLEIAEMYANSVNNCGKDTFTKRAVYWLAADYAERAARVNPAIKERANQTAASYSGRAPQKKDIFQADYNEGEAIQIGCWIGESVTVPAI